MEQNAAEMQAAHSIICENQQKASMTGISAVESFNEKQVNIKTASAYIVISGESLNVSKFNTENGTLIVEGRINEIKYSDAKKGSGIIKRLFK